MTDRHITQWAQRFLDAPRQNFSFVTVDQLIREKPSEKKHEGRLREIAKLPDRLCANCGQFNVWKFVMVEMPENDMCFTCITGETDASDDYELVP